MARKTRTVTIETDDPENRDKGKCYLITEMPASQAEKWAARAFLAMAHAGIEVPDELRGTGMAAIAVMGLRVLGGLAWNEAEPLLDEMLGCVQAIPDPTKPQIVRGLVENDIEEVTTRIFLRQEVFETHTGFSIAGLVSASVPAVLGTTESISNDTSTSPKS